MRNMSFFLTTDQVRNKTKDVTRRFAWWNVKPGETICAVEKCQGLKKGETINRLCTIRIISAEQERADEIIWYDDPQNEVAREGFPEMTAGEFVEMLCKANKKRPNESLMRIEFEYV